MAQLQAASVLFVDNPVGTGYSYVNHSSAYAKDLSTVTSDMMVLLKKFFSCKTEFQASVIVGSLFCPINERRK